MTRKGLRSNRMSGARRSLGLMVAIGALAAASVVFYYRQNFAGQIGGRMSLPKLLWLDYALVAWFVVPFYLWRSPRVAPELRRAYGAHLASFAVRGVAELWMLYVTVSWVPPYGIAHDLFTIVLITALRKAAPGPRHAGESVTERAARRLLTSIRVGLGCEIVFAWMFYRATRGELGIYFASTDPAFAMINGLTWVVVLVAYPDLLCNLWAGREALLPGRIAGELEVKHI